MDIDKKGLTLLTSEADQPAEAKEKAPQKAKRKRAGRGPLKPDVKILQMIRYSDMLNSFVFELDCAVERYCLRHGLAVEDLEDLAEQYKEENSDVPDEISEDVYEELYNYVARCVKYSPWIPVEAKGKCVKIVQR